jgi:dolichyl-diphosphooligosaccharide--protein glycosyltransferase
MDSATAEWWRRHGWTIGLLLVAFGIAFGLRTIWQYPVIQQYGALYTYAGGSDSYYHSRVMTYIIQTHRNLVFDPMLKFPVGAINPREPLFDWMNAVLGIVFAPFFGGNAVNAGAWFLDLESPLWAALAVFPIYLIGREASGRRTGLIAALVYPFFSASIDSSTFGYADYLSFYTFFLLVVIYSFLRMLKAIGHRRWVESYRHPRQFLPAVRGFLRTERTAVKWSVFTGVALGAFGLTWQGYTYAIVVIAFTILIAMLIERIRRVDSFGLYVSTWIVGLVAFPMLAPYYLVQGEIYLFLLLPIILFFGTLALLLPFLLMREVPWVFSIPTLVAIVGVALLGFRLLEPGLFAGAITGNGYFTKTLIYTTVAEAQAPSINALIVAYGVVTFFLAFAGLALFGYQLARQRFKRYHIAILIFVIVSIVLPISAAKFFLVASPAFALLSAEGIHRLLDVGGYPQLRRSVASLTDRTGRLSAFRKSFKARHVLVLALAVGILLPNVWIAIDAGIPSNTKTQVGIQINQTIPSWLKLNGSAPASNYLGAAGTGMDTSNQYDSAAYNWLATQDANLPEPQRPAFVSWWDYGFQAIDQGQHPSVADNFQNGIDPAGQFLLAQNESLAISVLAVTLLEGEMLLHHNPTLPAALNSVLARDGVDVPELHDLLTNLAADYSVVVRNPQTYLPVDPSTITDDNAMYLATSYYLADHLSLSGVAQVYDDLEAYTGWTIRYAMTDNRLFPFSGSDTGIFYAPADLTGRVISAEGTPTSFFNVTILGSDGNTYPLGPLPAGIGAVQYNINYLAPFYNSMIYRIYIGYNGTEVGQTSGIPGLSGEAAGDPVEPGWMLQHFEVEYRTAFVCPGVKNASAGSACMVATNRASANAIANRTNGTADLSSISYFEGGESMLAYYPGVTLYGRLASPAGQPVPGVRVTVYDGWGIPHMTNVTSANGAFSLVLPPGNDTLRFSYGTLNPLTQSDTTVIQSVKIPVSSALGFDTSTPSMAQTFPVRNGTVSGLVYWNVTGNATYDPSADSVVRGAQVVLTDTVGGSTLSATTDPSGTFLLPSVPPGIYNVTVGFKGQTYSGGSANVSSGGRTSLSVSLSPGTVKGKVLASGSGYADATVTLTSASGAGIVAMTNATGDFNFTGLPPGTYRVSAVGLDPAISSPQLQVSIPSTGGTAEVNLTLAVCGTAEVAVEARGVALPNATITFTPVPWLASTSLSPVGSLVAAATNTTFASTNSFGVGAVTLPVGIYTVAATARVAAVLYTALGTVNVTGPGATVTLLLNLTPARTVSVYVPGLVTTQTRTAVLAYAAGGPEVFGWAGANDSAVFELPDGSYSFLAVRGVLTAGAASTAGLAVANLTGPRTLSVPVGASVGVRFTVGTPAAGGKVFPAGNATVVLSAGPGGPVLRATADAAGAVGFLLPSGLLGAAGGYCLGASAFGFASATTCGLSLSELANLSTFDLAVNPVPVSLQVVGLPAKTSVTVNVTGETVGAVDLTLTGGPSFTFALPPGTYGVGARAEIGHGTTVYLPASLLNTTIPLGATYSNLTLVVVPEINASGKLTVPAGLTVADATVSLASPILNLTVGGTAYTKLFRATPGVYTATVTATEDRTTYASVTRVTLNANGTVEPPLVLAQQGLSATVDLLAPSGSLLSVNTTVTLVTPGGLTIVESSIAGSVSATVPLGTYGVEANFTTLTSGRNGTYFTDWTTSPSATCTFTTTTSLCSVTMVGTPVVVDVRGALVPAGGRSPVAGTVQLVGPYPSTNVTVVPAVDGTFSVALSPGAYDLYAVSTATPYLAALGKLLALPTTVQTVTIPLGATWTDALHLTVEGSSGVTVGPANVSVRDVFGDVTRFTDLSVGTVLDLALPPGTYGMSADASGSRNGVPGTASGSVTVSMAAGNAVTELDLSVPLAATVSATLAGPGSVSVAAGRPVTFDFQVHASGNVPVTFYPVGSPSGWDFAFSFGNVTLTPGANLSGEVRVTVPAGTAVDHAPVNIVFDLANGTEAGAVSPAPVVNVLAYYGLSAGTSSGSPPEVGSDQAILPFYVVDSGNTAETVQLSVVDAARLASYGWTTSFTSTSAQPHPGLFSLSAGQNLSVSLNLSAATASVQLPPGSVTVQVSVTSPKGSITSSVVLAVPRPGVAVSSGTLVVTGPSVQAGPSSVPDWFIPLVAFVPALLLVLGVLTYRWWRTRRWTRR